MTTFHTYDDPPVPSDVELAALDATTALDAWHCDTHGTIHNAKSRSWDNGDADPLHATMWEAYCPQCGIECLTVEEWAEEQAIDAEIEEDARPKRRYAFDGATKLLNINEDRQEFHHWAGRFVNLSYAYDEGTWRVYYRAFLICASAREHQIQDEDARDQANTHADALV